MSAHTRQSQTKTIERLTVLFCNAVELVRGGKRSEEAIGILLDALQRFKQNLRFGEVSTGLVNSDGAPTHIRAGDTIYLRDIGKHKTTVAEIRRKDENGSHELPITTLDKEQLNIPAGFLHDVTDCILFCVFLSTILDLSIKRLSSNSDSVLIIQFIRRDRTPSVEE